MHDTPGRTPASLPSGQFEPTRWSLVLRARGGDQTERRQAFDALCTAYWFPLYAYLRRSGCGVQDAEDLVQDFFVRLFEGGLLAGADPVRGRFRNLLLTALQNLGRDAFRAAGAAKRGGRVEIIHIDAALAEERWLADGLPAESPEAAFDRAWATEILRRAGACLQAEHTGARAPLFAELAPRLTTPGADEGLASIGHRLGMSEAAVKMALSRLRRRYAEAIRAEIAETVDSLHEVQAELRYLLSCFS